MFVRAKKYSVAHYSAIQIVENFRVDGKTKQRVLRHVGTAHSPEELEPLKQLAHAIKTHQ